MKRTSEKQIAACIVAISKRQAAHKATVAELMEACPGRIKLTRADREHSPTRPGEARWEQRVRNIRSHNSGERFGLRNIEGGFALVKTKPAKARAFLAREARV
jgi:hypothetical protein